VLVIDSRKNARAASAGSILVTRLMVRGVAGLLFYGLIGLQPNEYGHYQLLNS
jgi:regulator of RNase E activity RraA